MKTSVTGGWTRGKLKPIVSSPSELRDNAADAEVALLQAHGWLSNSNVAP
jgi:hypothetical protein